MKTKIQTTTNSAIALAVLALAAMLLAACPTEPAADADFSSKPSLVLTPIDNALTVTITDSVPPAGRYDLYWIEGDESDAAAVKAAHEISGAVSGVVIPNLENGATYSVLVRASKAGYTSVESAVANAVPAIGTFAALPVVTLNGGNTLLSYSINAAEPFAEKYELYWKEGSGFDAETVKAGTKITGVKPGIPGFIFGLTNETAYSVLVVAYREGYHATDSAIQTAAPGSSGAARGGNPSDTANWNYTYAGSDTPGDVAWYNVNAFTVGGSSPNYGINPVGGKAANAAGLHDMSGNASELCFDTTGPLLTGEVTDPVMVGTTQHTKKIARGGPYTLDAARQAVTYSGLMTIDNPVIGFRVASKAD
jgi:hypothetical protein